MQNEYNSRIEEPMKFMKKQLNKMHFQTFQYHNKLGIKILNDLADINEPKR